MMPKPSKTPCSETTADGQKVRPAALLLELGKMYGIQNNTIPAEAHYRAAFDVAVRAKDDTTMANALIGLGEVYKSNSNYFEAEEAFGKAHEILSRIGNDSEQGMR